MEYFSIDFYVCPVYWSRYVLGIFMYKPRNKVSLIMFNGTDAL